MTDEQVSRRYVRAQTVLLIAFALVYLTSGPSALSSPLVSGRAATLGLLLCLAGLALMFAALATIRGSIQVAPHPRSDARLVTRGVYAHLRHPIYTAVVLIVVGLWIRKPTMVISLGVVAVIGFLRAKVEFEETLLLERYPEYAAYRERTWGLIPGRRPRRR
jgi:protein-S-isoprenylcysteine O-methyltransferase Ste14